MSFFDRIFGAKRPDPQASSVFRTVNGYSPAFTSRGGSIYEADLIRSCIHAAASHASKLKPEIVGESHSALSHALASQPNPWQDTSKFLYRLMTILEANTTTFIVPITDSPGGEVVGVYPIFPSRAEMVDVMGEPWLRYTFADGTKAAIEYSRCGLMNKMQYRDEFFGAGNGPMDSTLDLLHTQEQGIQQGIKNSAGIRFLVRIAQTLKPDDIEAERKRFSADNLSIQNDSGVVFIDGKYESVTPLEMKPFVINAEQTAQIERRVFNYFGTHEGILQNKYDEAQWSAFYEGKIEQFALQLGLVLTNMVFTPQQRARGEQIMFSSNRLQYASNTTKLAVTKDLLDRGLLSNFAAADIWNLPHPSGDERWVIRGEYIDIANLPNHTVDNAKDYLKPAVKKEEE